jgi:hypothetical protein
MTVLGPTGTGSDRLFDKKVIGAPHSAEQPGFLNYYSIVAKKPAWIVL